MTRAEKFDQTLHLETQQSTIAQRRPSVPRIRYFIRQGCGWHPPIRRCPFIRACYDRLFEMARARIKLAVAGWKDGRYQAERFVDDDGIELERPDEEARYFSPMSIGSAPETADEGTKLISVINCSF